MKGRLFTMAMPLSALWPHSVLTLAIECFLSLSFSFLSLVIALSWLFTHVALSPPSAVDSQLQRSLRRANSCRKTNGAYCFFANGWPMHTDAALNTDCPLMNSMKIIIPLHFISCKKDSKRCCGTMTPESIHTKDESKCCSEFAFIFGVNWPLQWM